MEDNTKKCPYCAETIKAKAVVCRYCGRDLPADPPPNQNEVSTSSEKPQKKKSSRTVLIIVIVVALLFCCCLSVIISIPDNDTSNEGETNQVSEAEESATPTKSITNTPSQTPTSTPTSTPTPITNAGVTSGANLRGGPGTNYDIVGSVEAGDTLQVYARTNEGWLQVDGTGHTWITSSLVNVEVGLEEIPVTDDIPPTPTMTPTSTVTPTPNLTATARVQAQHATATAARQIVLNATATIEAYVDSPPVGTWCNQNNTRGVCVGDFRYVRKIGYTSAPSNGRFIAFGVAVKNINNNDISVSPLDMVLVMEDGRTYEYASETFSYWSTPMQSVLVAPGDSAQGGIVFLVPNDVAPQRIIYRGGFIEPEIEINLFDLPEPGDE